MNYLILSILILFCCVSSLNCSREYDCNKPKFTKNCRKVEDSKEFTSHTVIKCCKPHSKKNMTQSAELKEGEMCAEEEIKYCCPVGTGNQTKQLCINSIRNKLNITILPIYPRHQNKGKFENRQKTTKTTRTKWSKISYDNQELLNYEDMVIERNDGTISPGQGSKTNNERKNKTTIDNPINTQHLKQKVIKNFNTSSPKEPNDEHKTSVNTENNQTISEHSVIVNQTTESDQNIFKEPDLPITKINPHHNSSNAANNSSNTKEDHSVENIHYGITKIPKTTEISTESSTVTKLPLTPENPTTTKISSTFSESTSTTARPMRKSEQKCAEYGLSNIQKVKVMGLIGQKPREVTIDKCRHKVIPLIVGGREAMPYEFPHQALLGYKNNDVTEWKCGGSLVSRNFILTAAHCVEDYDLGPARVAKLGSFYQFEDSEKTIQRNIIQHIEHPNYDRLNRIDDIGLLKLDEFIKLTEYINPICLPVTQPDNRNAIAIGFGATETSFRSRRLMKVVLEQFEPYYPTRIANETHVDKFIFYGHRTMRKDTCSGDSGSPLQISNEMNVKCSYTQLGIVSYGPNECGIPGYPAVYVNVFFYIDWIERYIWEDEDRLEEQNKF